MTLAASSAVAALSSAGFPRAADETGSVVTVHMQQPLGEVAASQPERKAWDARLAPVAVLPTHAERRGVQPRRSETTPAQDPGKGDSNG